MTLNSCFEIGDFNECRVRDIIHLQVIIKVRTKKLKLKYPRHGKK